MICVAHMLASIFAMCANILFGITLFRCNRRVRLVSSVVYGCGAGLLFLIGIEIFCMWRGYLIASQNISSIIVNIVTYINFSYVYFHFVNMGETARRIRILRELYEAGKPLSRSEIAQRYSQRELVTKRIHRLEDNKQIVLKQGRYVIDRPGVLFMARVIRIMKRIVLGSSIGP